MRSVVLRQRQREYLAILAALSVSLCGHYVGNSTKCEVDAARMEIRGDEELLLWKLCKPSQQTQGIGLWPAGHIRYPDFLTVNMPDFSRRTYVACFSEPMSNKECLENVINERNRVASETGQRLAMMEAAFAKLKPRIPEAEARQIEEKIREYKEFRETNLKECESLSEKEVKQSMRPFVYEIDMNTLFSLFEQHKGDVRKHLGDQIAKQQDSSLSLEVLRSLGKEGERDAENYLSKTTDTYFQQTWRMADLLRLGIARKKPEPTVFKEAKPEDSQPADRFVLPSDNDKTKVADDILVRFDSQGAPNNARRQITQFSIFKFWKIFTHWREMREDALAQISVDSYSKLWTTFCERQKVLRATLSYDLTSIAPRHIEPLRTPLPEAVKRLYSQTKYLDKMPEDKHHVYTTTLVRQCDALKDVSAEITMSTAESLKEAEEKAKKDGDEVTKQADDN